MKTYIYSAALYCEPCALARMEQIRAMEPPPGVGHDWQRKSASEDSGDFPQGPYSDGGGEADTVQCCDDCRCLLGNPLTAEGYRYTAEMALENWNRMPAQINSEFWRDVIELYPEVFDDVSEMLRAKLRGEVVTA